MISYDIVDGDFTSDETNDEELYIKDAADRDETGLVLAVVIAVAFAVSFGDDSPTELVF